MVDGDTSDGPLSISGFISCSRALPCCRRDLFTRAPSWVAPRPVPSLIGRPALVDQPPSKKVLEATVSNLSNYSDTKRKGLGALVGTEVKIATTLFYLLLLLHRLTLL